MIVTETNQYCREQCSQCSIVFYVPESWQQKRIDYKDIFHCPNGHQQVYSGKSDAQKLIEANRELNAAKQREIATTDQLRTERADKEKLAARISHGVCPCCNRTFKNLQRHMKTQHGDNQPAAHAAEKADRLAKSK